MRKRKGRRNEKERKKTKFCICVSVNFAIMVKRVTTNVCTVLHTIYMYMYKQHSKQK